MQKRRTAHAASVLQLRRIRRSELPPDTIELARMLIGKILVHNSRQGRLVGRIVETEAYPVGDASAHSFRGLTQRTRSLFLERGHAYVYFIYGVWYCLNVSSESEGIGGGVLLRALEPLEGIPLMEKRRGTKKIHDLARGPGRLAQAMGIDRKLDGIDLCRDTTLWLATGGTKARSVRATTRIGISREKERPLRFYEAGSPFVSGPKHILG
jgi:DNA-3-methyladenine glycosylase